MNRETNPSIKGKPWEKLQSETGKENFTVF